MALSGTDQTVWDAHLQCPVWKDAKRYLEEHGHKLSHTSFYRRLAKIKDGRRDELYEIAKNSANGTVDRLATIRTCEKMLFEVCKTTGDDGVKVRAIKEIKELQYAISAYEESSQAVLERDVRIFGKKDPEHQGPDKPRVIEATENRSTQQKTN